MAVSTVGSSLNTNTGVAITTVGIASGVVANDDIIVVFQHTYDGAQGTGPSGYTQIAAAARTTGNQIDTRVWAKRSNGTESSSLTVPVDSPGAYQVLASQIYRGCSNASLADAVHSVLSQANGNDTTPVGTSLTAGRDGSLALLDKGGYGGTTSANPASWTMDYEDLDSVCDLGNRARNASETTGTGSMTQGSDSWTHIMLILQPAAGGSVTLTADTGVFTMTGVAVTFRGSIVAATGSYTLTGNAVAFAAKMTSSTGTYTMTGNAVAFHGSMVAAEGSFTLTGNDVAFGISLVASVAAFVLTGYDITFIVSGGLVAETGVFTMTGHDAGFKTLLVADVGDFALTGYDVTFSQSTTLTAETGVFALTGNDVAFGISLVASAGSFALTGYPVADPGGDGVVYFPEPGENEYSPSPDADAYLPDPHAPLNDPGENYEPEPEG